MRKSSMNVLRVQAENKEHLYCKFITLTYDNNHIPRMYISRNDDYMYSRCGHRYTLVDSDYGNVLGYMDSLSDYKTLCRKTESQDLPFLRKYDLQLFFKRLRKYFTDYGRKYNIPIGKIRYFACGEYGPKRFRPHYHIILWTSCDEINMEIGKAVSSCWTLGRVATETPFQDVSQYVAKYVNGSCPLPSIFKWFETKPFSVHSLHLGESIFQAEREKIYELPYSEIVKRNLFINGSYTVVSMWRSLKTYYFPRCKEYHVFSTQQRYEAYTLIERVLQRFPQFRKESISSLTEYILQVIKDEYQRFGIVRDSLMASIERYIDTGFFLCDSKEEQERAYRSLYMVLRVSNHFCKFVCNNNLSYFNTHRMLSIIERFWKDDELYLMNNGYKSIEDSTDELFDNEEEYLLRFSLSPELIQQTKVFKKYREERLSSYRNSMKHKELNDLNRVFEQY